MTEPRVNLEELKARATRAQQSGEWLLEPFIGLATQTLALIAEVEASRAEVEALRKQVYSLEPLEDGTGGVSWELVAFHNAAVINAAEEEIKQLQDGQSGTKRLRALLRQRYRPGDTVDLPTLRELGRTCGIQSDHVRAIANGERLRVIARPASPVDATHEQVIGGRDD